MQKPGGMGLLCGTVLVLSEGRIKFRVYRQDNLKDPTDAFLNNLCPAAPNPQTTYSLTALCSQDQPMLRPSALY